MSAAVRTDIVDVYVFRRGGRGRSSRRIQFLQLLRAREPMRGSWQPVMGRCEAGESALGCAMREMREEVWLDAHNPALVGVWALQRVRPYFMASVDAIVLSPGFAVEAAQEWEPTLNEEHTAARWVSRRAARRAFLWPGQRGACEDIAREIAPERSAMRALLRVTPGSAGQNGR